MPRSKVNKNRTKKRTSKENTFNQCKQHLNKYNWKLRIKRRRMICSLVETHWNWRRYVKCHLRHANTRMTRISHSTEKKSLLHCAQVFSCDVRDWRCKKGVAQLSKIRIFSRLYACPISASNRYKKKPSNQNFILLYGSFLLDFKHFGNKLSGGNKLLFYLTEHFPRLDIVPERQYPFSVRSVTKKKTFSIRLLSARTLDRKTRNKQSNKIGVLCKVICRNRDAGR